MLATCNLYIIFFLIKTFNDEVLKNVSGQQWPRTSCGSMQEIKIPVPLLAEQQKLVVEIEAQIAVNQTIINEAATQKQAIMKKYL